MKILFVVTGIGYGDSIRINTIINEFKKDNPHHQYMIAGYDNSYNYFKNNYSTINIRGYKIPGKDLKFKILPFVLKNFFIPIIWLFSAFKIKKAVKKFNPDIIVSDFEPTGALFAKLVKKDCVMLFGYDPLLYKKFKEKHKVSKIMQLQAKYLEQIYQRGDYVIIPTLLGAKKRSMVYNYVNLITPQYSKIASKEKIMKKLKLKKEPILIMLGGSDFGQILLKKIAKITNKFKNENFIVFGSKKLKNVHIEHYAFKDNILEYLKVSKGIITLAGKSTLSEAIAFKKPMLIYPIKNHIEQILNAYEIDNLALIRKNTKHIEQDLKKFLKSIPEMQKKMNQIKIKNNGAKEIVKIVKIFAKS